MLKRISIVFLLALACSLVFAGAAFANFGPHGGYVDDTDSCAGCHRAHTSFSTVGWTDSLGTPHDSALLVGSATTMTEFCNACHGDNAPGASTNVVNGVFDSGPTGANGQGVGADNNGVTVAYQSESTFNQGLNGGGFSQCVDPDTGNLKASTSAHNMEAAGPLWGAGSAVPTWPNLTCTDCHDPHGTSNYRLLKAEVNNHTVGGYTGTDGETPNAFVYSYETGYPNPQTGTEGWLKHEDGAVQMADYRPNYTGGTKIMHTDGTGEKSLSTWCAACHENYATSAGNTAANGGLTGTYDYDGSVGAPGSENNLVGAEVRHRHPVNTPAAGEALTESTVFDARVPLEVDESNLPANPADFKQDFIGCLTCHTAHGSSADMTGWAAAHLTTNAGGTVIPVRDGIPGVSPTKNTSSLLRADNRGVCERCHNK